MIVEVSKTKNVIPDICNNLDFYIFAASKYGEVAQSVRASDS